MLILQLFGFVLFKLGHGHSCSSESMCYKENRYLLCAYSIISHDSDNDPKYLKKH